MSNLGINAWGISALLAAFSLFIPECHAAAIVIAILGTGFSIMAQIAAIAEKLKLK